MLNHARNEQTLTERARDGKGEETDKTETASVGEREGAGQRKMLIYCKGRGKKRGEGGDLDTEAVEIAMNEAKAF